LIGLAVDLGGSHATCAIVKNDKLFAQSTLAVQEHADLCDFASVMKAVADQLIQLCHQANIKPTDAAGLVFGFPGIVDSRMTRVVATNKKFDQALRFDFTGWGKEHFHLPVVVENDARLALLGEHASGAAQNAEDAVLITLGTGIGAAAMIGGKLLRGTQDRAGCLGGHLPVVAGGRLCTCGNRGCAEAEASTWALPAICSEMPGFTQSSLRLKSRLDFADVFRCADEGDAVAQNVLSHCYLIWGTLAIALIHAYSPQVLIFGGAVMAREKVILSGVRPYVERHAWALGGVRVEASALGANAAIYGTIPRLQEASC